MRGLKLAGLLYRALSRQKRMGTMAIHGSRPATTRRARTIPILQSRQVARRAGNQRTDIDKDGNKETERGNCKQLPYKGNQRRDIDGSRETQRDRGEREARQPRKEGRRTSGRSAAGWNRVRGFCRSRR